MNNLLNAAFWFNQRPGSLIPLWRNSVIAVVIVFLAIAATSFVFKKKPGIYSKLWERLFNFSTTNFFIGSTLLFFNSEMIPMLSSRFWYLLWLIGSSAWVFFIVRYAMTLPEKKKEFEKKREFEKYLPK